LKLVVVTTVPETLFTILSGQPNWLSQYFSVVCITSPGQMFEAVALQENVELVSVDMVRGINPFKDILSIYQMRKVLRRIKPDVVHSYTPKAGLVAMLGAYLAGVKVRIHTFTGLVFPTTRGFKRFILALVDRLICHAATHIVPEGVGVANDLKSNNITTKDLDVIGNGNIAGVDVSYFAPGHNASTDISFGSAFVFCFVGRLNRDKGIKELVSSFLRMESDAALVLVGGLDDTAPVDQETLRQIDANSRIYKAGFVKDIRPFIAASDVVVLPSYREGFPNVILQAGAMEKAVIATDINGCNEVIENGFNGWLVSPRSSDELAEKMLYAASLSNEELALIGKNARARIVERYEQENYRTKLLEFYRKVL